MDQIETFNSTKMNAEALLERVKSEAAAYLAEETKKAEAKEAEDSKAWFDAYDVAVTKAKTLKKDAEDAQAAADTAKAAYDAKTDDADLKKAWEDADFALKKAYAASQRIIKANAALKTEKEAREKKVADKAAAEREALKKDAEAAVAKVKTLRTDIADKLKAY